MAKDIIAAYIPVLHDGYMELMDRHEAAEIGVIDVAQFPDLEYLRKDPRALQPKRTVELLHGIGRSVHILGQKAVARVMTDYDRIIVPADDVTKVLFGDDTSRLTVEPVMLRWDRERLKLHESIEPDNVIDETALPQGLLELLYAQKSESTSWWLQIGAVVFDEQDPSFLMATHNHSVPTPYTSAVDGDPRDAAYRGVGLHAYVDIHAEADAIAQAAKAGVSLEGRSILTTDYPCPNCAKLIASCGISRCYFIEGYAVADGQAILKNSDVRIIKVNVSEAPETRNHISKPYRRG
jgi:dCMP deaminase